MPERNLQELYEIPKNLEALAIIDFIPNDKLKEFDEKVSKFFGHGVSIEEPRLLPWKTIEYSSAIYHLGKDKGIPDGLSDIQLIQVRHIGGVALEIICYCKIDKAAFEGLFDKSYEESIRNHILGRLRAQIKAEVDNSVAEKEIEKALNSIDLTKKYNFENEFVFDFSELAPFLKDTRLILTETQIYDYFNARLKFIEGLQKGIEDRFQDLIPGIYLSKKEKCLSTWIYDLSNSDVDIVKKAKNNSLFVNDAYEWKSKFEYRSKFPGEEIEYHGTDLSLIGWTIIDKTYEFVSLLGRNFIIGYGMEYKDSYLGNYNANYIVLKLRKDPEIRALFGSLETETALTSLSKFLFPTEWIKHSYSALLELNKDQRDLPILEFKTDIHELSSELGTQIKSFEEENKKRVKSILSISKISEDLRYLESLIVSNTSFLSEVKNEKFRALSEYLLEDSNFWLAKIREEIRAISEKQSLRIQYLHDTISTLNSFINIKYQEKIENLTRVLLLLTATLVILAIVPAISIIKDFLTVILVVWIIVLAILILKIFGGR